MIKRTGAGAAPATKRASPRRKKTVARKPAHRKTTLPIDLKSKIRGVPDYPKKGIYFYDVTTLLKDGPAYRQALDEMARPYARAGIDKVVGVESRGFILGAPVAYRLNAGFIPVRKPGKLPHEIYEVRYNLEYGSDGLTIHRDAVHPGEKILIVDDLLATGGTCAATVQLVEKLGGVIVGIVFLIELKELNGRSKLKDHPVRSLLLY